MRVAADIVRRYDIDAIHAYIGGESYWAKGRPKERMRAAIDGSARVIGLYNGAEHPHGGQDPQILDVAAMNRKNTRSA